LVRRTHKWLAILIGVQALIWTLSGLYMTAVHIDIIHGDHFIRVAEPRPLDLSATMDPAAAARAVPGAQSAKLHWLIDRPTYIVASEQGPTLVDASTGSVLPPPSSADIRRLAEHWFTGEETLVSVSLIDELPGEIRGRDPPVWRADFDGWNKPTLYFSPATGELLTRRHELWRVFDLFWTMHIMDYRTRDNVNNWLIQPFNWGALLLLLSGAWLLLYSFGRRGRKEGKRR
jgi:hypothetical protein